ncbi:MAG: hypothetical protein RRA94_01895 [Bacteroidota bacterium]|nr:hypothetical protein [Bacteroidota bacterium]
MRRLEIELLILERDRIGCRFTVGFPRFAEPIPQMLSAPGFPFRHDEMQVSSKTKTAKLLKISPF